MEIHALTVRELADHIAQGEVSVVEVVHALHARADTVGERVNGFVHQVRERALEDARAADVKRARGDTLPPLHGVPMSVKESVDTKGLPSTLGLASRRNAVATRDAVAVEAATRAGAILLGKTNVPQTLLCPMDSTNHLYGTTYNPWNPGRGAGGSSGGEAAVLATGQSPFGIGTDVGGSIRLPAAFCGIAGLRPTVGRWSNLGSNTCIAGQEAFRSQIGPMARSAADLAFVMRALDGTSHHALDPMVPPLPLGDARPERVHGMRIGFYEDDGFITPAASVRRAVREAAAMLEDAGATLVPLRPANAEAITYLYFKVMTSDGGELVERALAGEKEIAPLSVMRKLARMPDAARKAIAKGLELASDTRVAKLLQQMGRRGVGEYYGLVAERDRFRREEALAWERDGLDAIVCPAHVTTAAPHDLSKDFTLAISYCLRWNVLGNPSGVVPVTRVRDDETTRRDLRDRVDKRAASIEAKSAGLPVGVQVVARPYREDTALAVMQAIEDRARRDRDFPWTPIDPR